MNNKCSGIIGAIFGHKFVARYDRIPPDLEGGRYSLYAAERLINLTTQRIYKGDVCTRCGLRIEVNRGRS